MRSLRSPAIPLLLVALPALLLLGACASEETSSSADQGDSVASPSSTHPDAEPVGSGPGVYQYDGVKVHLLPDLELPEHVKSMDSYRANAGEDPATWVRVEVDNRNVAETVHFAWVVLVDADGEYTQAYPGEQALPYEVSDPGLYNTFIDEGRVQEMPGAAGDMWFFVEGQIDYEAVRLVNLDTTPTIKVE